MSTATNLDVLVVYSASIAKSATIPDSRSLHPFMQDSCRANYNLSYAYFLEACRKQGLTAGFTSSIDIIGPGTCSNYWTTNSSGWQKVAHDASSKQIFAKLSAKSASRLQERQLLFSDPSIIPFNNQALHTTFFDKLLTYRALPHYAVPTVNLRSANPPTIHRSLERLRALIKNHPFPHDFTNSLILKDRFGAGGQQVYKITRNYERRIAQLMQAHPQYHYILQPFLRFDKGYNYRDVPSTVDVRLIFQYNQVIQSYLRVAQTGEFLCNEHQGGNLIYIPPSSVPSSILKIASKLVAKLNRPDSLYALDFVVSNSGKVYFLEGNIGPGIDWDIRKPVNEKMSKQLIDHIVKEFASRIHD